MECRRAGERMANALARAQLDSFTHAHATRCPALKVFPDGSVKEIPLWEFWACDGGEDLAAALMEASRAPATA